jgi:hypothetical protein
MNYSIVTATVCLIFLTIAPQVYAVDNVTSVDWTYVYAFGGNRWTACAEVNGRAAGLLSYTFHYGTYTKTGSLDLGGCFELAQQNVGQGFSYGSTYSLTVGNSRPKTLAVSTQRTLGGSVVPISNLTLLLSTIGLIGLVATATVLVVGFYIVRRKPESADQ